MEVFVVTGTVRIAHYMREDKPTVETVTRQVRAETNYHAMERFREHYESKTSEYEVYYRVYNIECDEIIE